MEKHGSVRIFPRQIDNLKETLKKESLLPPWLFQHEDLTKALEQAQPVKLSVLINTINYIHFMDGCVFAHMNHPRYTGSVLIKAYPEPCTGEELTCRWLDGNLSGLRLESYRFNHLIIADGRSIILVPAQPLRIDGEGFKVILPETGFALCKRDTRRYLCQGVKAELVQNGFQASGVLLDFSPMGFRIRVKPEMNSSFNWFDADDHVTIKLINEAQVVFSGACTVIRQTAENAEREIVLVPTLESISRIKTRQIRNPRQKLLPSPTITFEHPLFKKKIRREILDISATGFSVLEKADEGVLMIGMVIPRLSINYAGILKMDCTAQVVYRRQEEDYVRYGLSILDMDIKNYSRLSHVLNHSLDPCSYISNEVDMDALWEFFFDTGFIYPKKYSMLQSYRDEFKETYRKLYQENPEIARHFTYEKDGRIYSHISMVRAYEKTWLIHHHAARPMDSKVTGFLVLRQLIQYINGMHRLPSAKLDYIICYFRPENRIPDRIYGGFARELKNPRAASLDLFAYLPYPTSTPHNRLPDGWLLTESSAVDLWELDRFYRNQSGGLLTDVLNLGKQRGEEFLEDIYSRLGFLRKCSAFSLTFNGELKAVLIRNQSDLGFNLSELVNGLKVIVVDPEGLPFIVLSIAIAQLVSAYDVEKIPVLLYPADYVEAKGVPCDKRYQMWIFDVRYGSEYLEYMEKNFRIRFR